MPDIQDRANAGGLERRVFSASMEVRAKQDGTGGTRYDLEGYASAYDKFYEMLDMYGEYEEVVRQGSGARSLGQNPDVVLVFNHAGFPMARTKTGNLQLSEDTAGLHMLARDLNGNISVVRDVVAGVQDGVLDEMSFAFRVTRQEWSPDFMQREILEYNIHRGDVSVVTYGANPATSVDLRAQLDRALSTLDGDELRHAHARLTARLAELEPKTQGHPLSLYDAEARLLTMPPVAI